MSAYQPIKVLEIELSRPLTDIVGLDGYRMARILVRRDHAPVGMIDVPVVNGRCAADQIIGTAESELADRLAAIALDNLVGAATQMDRLDVTTAVSAPPLVPDIQTWPLVTVAVCTRDRTESLADCLRAIGKLDYPALDVLVVDNAPQTDATQQLLAAEFPQFRYVREPLPGLDNARNRAILAARGKIIAYTDDDVIVDAQWARAIAALFVQDPDVTAVTGLVLPYELETESQYQFELYGGFNRGYDRQWYRGDPDDAGDVSYRHGGTGKFGTGANMAFRRGFLQRTGGFDPALDVGTVTNGGGDLDIFYRVLKEGHTLAYEPRAMVWHAHRRTYARLRTQIANNGVGLYSFWVRTYLHYPEERFAIFRLAFWWLRWWLLRRLAISLVRPAALDLPRDLVWAELWGAFQGLGRYQKARQHAPPSTVVPPALLTQPAAPARKSRQAAGVFMFDLSQPLPALPEAAVYRRATVYVLWQGQLLGSVEIRNDYHPISLCQLRDEIAAYVHLKLLADAPLPEAYSQCKAAIAQQMLRPTAIPAWQNEPRTAVLPATVPVSIVVATLNRPQDLYGCLTCLTQQHTERPLEIIVVDNDPASGQTWPVVTRFPGVKYVAETRRGLSYARNAGILAGSGEIVVCTDDDVVMETDWLEKLLTPFVDDEVMIVTGNVLPREMETEAQRRFEEYGGLGRGFVRRRYDADWFGAFRYTAVPTWELGATANAAFRALIFDHPQIGLLDEVICTGSPTGIGEDTLLFYQVLKAGYAVVYEPAAFVWHNHRKSDAALRRQLHNYSKGHVAYNLATLVRYGDWRALPRIFVWLPIYYAWRTALKFINQSDYPTRLMLTELGGNLLGPWGYFRSWLRMRRLGRSRDQQPTVQAIAAPLPTLQPTRSGANGTTHLSETEISVRP